jgi:hypothetical protein
VWKCKNQKKDGGIHDNVQIAVAWAAHFFPVFVSIKQSESRNKTDSINKFKGASYLYEQDD